MNRKPLPYPSQMRNGGLPPAHLPSSPHYDPVAAILSNLKAIVSNAIIALAEKATRCQQLLNKHAACARQRATRRQQLLNEQAACARQEAARRQQLLDEQAARARQEAAATRARQEAAQPAGRPPPAAP